ALAAGDDMAALGLASVGEILAHHLELRLDGHLAAAHQTILADAASSQSFLPVAQTALDLPPQTSRRGRAEPVEPSAQDCAEGVGTGRMGGKPVRRRGSAVPSRRKS